VFDDAFLPGRNLLFLLIGAARAYQNGCAAVAIGLLDPRSHLFGDQTQPFLQKAQAVLGCALGLPLRVLAPLIQLNKADVLALAGRLGVMGTYSCHRGDRQPCGKCISCREIRGALAVR
jgi:7-cyano-7-deazaguanine synthase